MSRSPKKGNSPEDRNRRRQRDKASRKPGSPDALQDSGGPSVVWAALQSAGGRNWLLAAAVVAAVFLAYQPAWHGGFVWDDDLHLLNNPVLKPGGVVRTWLHGDYINYWPLTFTVYRIEFDLWGLDPLGFHLVNIALHAVSALLVWRILIVMQIPGALFAAAIFALHPVNVESVAWITQLKNLLSLSLALLSMLFYLLHERDGGWWRFAASVGLFLLSALAKGMMLTLPVVLLACAWWQRGRIGRRDLLRVLPFLLIAALMVCIEVKKQHLGAGDTPMRSDDFFSRAAVAGCAVWFYFWKLIWPVNLMFVYPRWNISERDVLSYLPGMLLAAILALAWWQRRSWGRPVAMVMVCYVALLLPILGFANIYFMQYSLVADHYQYAAMIVFCAAFAGAAVTLGRRCVTLLSRDGKEAGGDGRLWKTHLSRLGRGAGREGRLWRKAQLALGQLPAGCLLCLGVLMVLSVLTFRQSGMFADEETLYRATIERNPGCWLAHNNLGTFLLDRGHTDEAIMHFEEALKSKHDYVLAHCNLGNALASQGHAEKAIMHYKEALTIDPDCVDAYYNLAVTLAKRGRIEEAIAQYHNALKISPNDVSALNSLAWLRATHPKSEFRDGAEAVELAERALHLSGGQEPTISDTLAAAYAEAGRFPEAVRTARMALDLAMRQNNEALAESVKVRMRLYDARTPYRNSSAAAATPAAPPARSP